MDKFQPTDYTLMCVANGRQFEDTGWVLEDRTCEQPSLVRAIYKNKKITVKSDDYGIYKFCDWLPVKRILQGSSAPVTYKSEALATQTISNTTAATRYVVTYDLTTAGGVSITVKLNQTIIGTIEVETELNPNA